MEKKDTNKKKVLKPIYYTVTILAASLALTFSLLNMNGCTSLVGPQGDQGEKGEKGDDGEKGEPGKKGETGEQGEKGDTGSKGETGDQGQKGDQGEKGDTGSKGETGDKGDKGNTGSTGMPGYDAGKYYNCVIFPSENGYVTLDKGSYKAGDTVTFTIVPNNGYGISSFKVNDKELITDSNIFITTTITTEMVENGLVVKSEYAKLSTNGTNAILDIDNMICYDTMDDVYNAHKNYPNYIYYKTVNLKLYSNTTLANDFNLYYSTLNLDLGNNHTLTSSALINAYYYGGINITGKGTIVNETKSYMMAAVTGKKYSLYLTVGSDVVTKCTNGSAILFNVGATYTDANHSKIIYKGTDYSQTLLNVSGNIKKSSNPANITIEGATIYSNMYLAGFANYVINNSTFNTSDTAIKAKSGNITLTGNKFNVTLAGDYTFATPAYVACSNGGFGGSSTVMLESGLSDYAGFGTFTISNNTFNRTSLSDKWYDFIIYQANNDAPVPEITESTYKVLRNSDFYGKIQGVSFTDGESAQTCDIYFLTVEAMCNYTPSSFKEEYSLTACEDGAFDNKYCTRDGDSWTTPGAKPSLDSGD